MKENTTIYGLHAVLEALQSNKSIDKIRKALADIFFRNYSSIFFREKERSFLLTNQD